MYSLIVSSDGEDYVYVSTSRSKLEARAFTMIKSSIDSLSETSEFGKLEIDKLLIQSVEVKDIETAMDLFAEISDVYGDMVYLRIVNAEIEMDS